LRTGAAVSSEAAQVSSVRSKIGLSGLEGTETYDRSVAPKRQRYECLQTSANKFRIRKAGCLSQAG
jgi:hypothetical protein